MPIRFEGSADAAAIAAHLENIDCLPDDGLPWKRMTGLDDYAIISGVIS